MKAKIYNIIGRTTALISFIAGTIIYIILIMSDLDLSSFVFTFLFFAFIINLIILIFVLAKVVTDEENRDELFKTALLILVNIPIIVLYFFIGMAIS